MTTRPRLEPLKLSCTRADCGNGLHCFRESKRRAAHPRGSCQKCGIATLVEWSRVSSRKIEDVEHTVQCLQREWIRHHFWHAAFDQRALNYALRKGRGGLRAAIRNRIRKSVGVKHSRDGQQTGWAGNILYYAQHATACCCRKCIECWHGIDPGAVLSDNDVEYFAELCLRYLWARLPDLPENGQHVPPIRGG